jgi:hypothetical protein
MLEHPRITLAPEVLAGKPVIRGTRLSVEFVTGLPDHASFPRVKGDPKRQDAIGPCLTEAAYGDSVCQTYRSSQSSAGPRIPPGIRGQQVLPLLPEGIGLHHSAHRSRTRS